MMDKTFAANYSVFKERVSTFENNMEKAFNGHGEFKLMQKGDLDSHLASLEASVRYFKAETRSPQLIKILDQFNRIFKLLYQHTNGLKNKDLVFVSKLDGKISMIGKDVHREFQGSSLHSLLRQFEAACTKEKLI